MGTLQRYRVEHPRSPHLLETSLYLLDYPFETRLYPEALNVVATFAREARVVILSDGDVVFQPHKVDRSGLWSAFDGHVLIYIHKEQMLDDVAERYPASHYVMIDDKPRVLAAMKNRWGPRLTTVFVRQGHYATDPAADQLYPSANVTIDRIADLTTHEVTTLVRARTDVSIASGG